MNDSMVKRPLYRRVLRDPFLVCVVFGIVANLALQAQTASSLPSGVTDDTHAKTPAYDVVSIKPNKSASGTSLTNFPPDGFVGTNVSLDTLIYEAYGIIMDSQISGLPGWARSDLYDIEAKVDSDTAARWKSLPFKERRKLEQPMLQSILADRCQFRAHQETRELPAYDLVIAKGGLKMKEAPPDEHSTEYMSGETITAHAVSANSIAYAFSDELGRMIVDKTGLGDKKFDFELKWTPDDRRDAGDATDAAPSLFTALEEQLGLKLVPSKAPVEVLVIDHMEKPSAN
jgi:uncharacterized protein (TIGR03435 family)